MSAARVRSRFGAGAWLLPIALLASGCIETRLYSGSAPGRPAPSIDERWHSAFLFGTTDMGRVYKLDSVCPGGWSEIVIAQDTLTTILSVATLFLYTPSRVTVVCSLDTGSLDPARAGELYPPPADPIDD